MGKEMKGKRQRERQGAGDIVEPAFTLIEILDEIILFGALIGK